MRVPFVSGRELISACEYHSSQEEELKSDMRVPFVTGRELISACEYHSSQEGS